MKDVLQRVSACGVVIDPEGAVRLETYCRLVQEWSERAGLVSPNDLQEFAGKHVAASLGPLLVAPVRADSNWVDVGSGAGLPGMVIKICRPELEMTLIDSSRKKTIFLEGVRDRLGMNGLRVLQARVESVVWGESGDVVPGHPALARASTTLEPGRPYDVVLMRAVAPLARSLPLLNGIAASGCRLVTFKGASWRSEVEAARVQMEQTGWVLVEARQIPWAAPKLLVLERHQSLPNVSRETSEPR